MEKEGRGIFRAGRGTQPGTAHSETPREKGRALGRGHRGHPGTPAAAPTPSIFAPTSRGPSGQLWKDVQGTALAEGER